jgi:hypothetical protein
MHAYVLANILDQTSWLCVGEGELAAQSREGARSSCEALEPQPASRCLEISRLQFSTHTTSLCFSHLHASAAYLASESQWNLVPYCLVRN